MGWIEPFAEWLIDTGQGLILFAVLALVGAVREWWVWGNTYRRQVEETEYWRQLAVDQLGLSERAAAAAESVILNNLEETPEER